MSAVVRVDLEQWTKEHPGSRLAQVAYAAVEYADARTTIPSDSFPGLLAQVTGGTSRSTGVFYDDAAGNIPLFTSIDPKNLPMGMLNGVCQGVYPHSFLKVNTIFNVAHDAGLYTAWSDKHPAYETVRGPQNTGAEDLFTPEINNVNDPTAISVAATTTYDQLKVQAILNEIDGMTSDAAHTASVPAIFGMNFQSVSVGEKLAVTPDQDARRVAERVETRQIAPTILKFLGLSPHALESVRLEHTRTLPGLEGGR
jgi:hypothetical protein